MTEIDISKSISKQTYESLFDLLIEAGITETNAKNFLDQLTFGEIKQALETGYLNIPKEYF